MERLQRLDLREYCNGITRGSMGETLQLGLEALNRRPTLY